jgi:hypothetical protein
MIGWLLIGASLAMVSSVVMRRRRAAQPLLPSKSDERTLSNLQPGDVLQHLGEDFVVEAASTFSSAGAQFYTLSGERYLFVAAPSEPWLLTRASGIETPSDTLNFDGALFRCESRARHIVQSGTSLARGEAQVARYRGPGKRVLLIFSAPDGGSVTAYVGESVRPGLFEILPGG